MTALALAPQTASSAPLASRVVDHRAIARNVARMLGASATPMLAVVKADAFGHGAVEVARTVLAAGASWLGVATVTEALELRAAGITAPILAWLVDPWSDLERAVTERITLSCSNDETLSAVERAARATGTTALVHLELDTGMARGGSTESLWPRLCEDAALAERSELLRVTGVWSHLARASDPSASAIEEPSARFQRGVGVATAYGLAPEHIHLANSAAALAHPATRLSMIRVGAALYGIETVTGRTHGLEPALRLTSRVSQLRTASAGTGVGYSARYVLGNTATLALVPIGYGDGVPTRLSDGGEVVIGGRRYPVRGAVSMDQLVVEVDPLRVELGDEVILLGNPGRGEPDAAEWARIAGTLPHDILTGLGARAVRTHVGSRYLGAAA